MINLINLINPINLICDVIGASRPLKVFPRANVQLGSVRPGPAGLA